MVVKFADTQKEKDQKRIHQATGNLWAGAAAAAAGIGANMAINNLQPQYLTVYLLLRLYSMHLFNSIQCYIQKGLGSNGTANLSQLGGLNALSVQQLLAASSQNSLASSQGE